jgi:PhnB protein
MGRRETRMKPARKAARGVEPIPQGYHSITPYFAVRGAGRAIDFYKKAFGAEELGRMPGPDGKSIVHAELKIGDSRFFVHDESPETGSRSPEALGGTPSGIYLYVEDADEVFRKAVAAGATVKHDMMDAFWGDRSGTVVDPFGYEWQIATHTEDVPPEEIKRRGEEFFKQFGAKPS